MSTVKLQDIADRAGVSRMTVSRALRNLPSVSEETRRQITEIAREMDYRPNPLVSALMANLQTSRRQTKTRSIAFFTFSRSEEEWRRIGTQAGMFRGAEARANELGWHLSPVWINEPGLVGSRLSRILAARGIEGILVGGMPRHLNHLKLDWNRYAVAALGYSLTRPVFHRVASNHSQSIHLAIRLLRRRGYRRIGLALLAQEDIRLGNHLLGSYLGRQAYFKKEERVEPFLCRSRNNREGFTRWLKEQRPDVILSGNGTRSIVDWLGDLGLRIPADIGVALLGPLPAALLGPVPPALRYAHIERDYHRLGHTAVDLVVDQLHRNERGVPSDPHSLLLDTRWVEGYSVREARP